LVEIFKAWKKLICEGSSPVGPAGTEKSIGAITPILASVGILLASILPLSSWTEASVKIRATFCLSNGVRAWSSGSFPPNCCYKCLNYSSSMANSHFKDFLDEGIFGNDKLRLEGSESFSDLLDLT